MARTAPPSAAPGTTSRTRRAILDAAFAVLARDRQAPMSEIAKAAEVGRSTLHRYFPDRAALLKGLLEDANQATERTIVEARLGRGTPEEAFERLISTMFDLGPRVNFLFTETHLDEDDWDPKEWETAHRPVGELFLRGQGEGYFDQNIDADWFVRILWYTIAAGWQAVAEGALPKHQAVNRVARTLKGGLLDNEPRGAGGPAP